MAKLGYGLLCHFTIYKDKWLESHILVSVIEMYVVFLVIKTVCCTIGYLGFLI